MSSHLSEPVPPEIYGQDKGLKAGALGLVGSVVVGLASTAPAYSLAATLGLIVVGGAGVKAAAIILLAFVPMYFIAVAYKELNEAEPDCGTTFTWATRAFGPVVGWMGGWGIIVADIIVMAIWRRSPAPTRSRWPTSWAWRTPWTKARSGRPWRGWCGSR